MPGIDDRDGYRRPYQTMVGMWQPDEPIEIGSDMTQKAFVTKQINHVGRIELAHAIASIYGFITLLRVPVTDILSQVIHRHAAPATGGP